MLAKGNYFTFTGRPVFKRLIYPTPIVGGLGVHVTLDLAGRMRFGPDVEWIERENLRRRSRPRRLVLRAHPHLLARPAGRRAGAGLFRHPAQAHRAAASRPADFLIDAPAQHGLPGLVQMFGIESPGLTSSLSLAEEVAGYLES